MMGNVLLAIGWALAGIILSMLFHYSMKRALEEDPPVVRVLKAIKKGIDEALLENDLLSIDEAKRILHKNVPRKKHGKR